MLKSCEKKVSRRVKPKSLSLSKRKGELTPVESGFRKAEAIKEARRCLGINACEACEVCSLFCPDLCITRDEKSGSVLIDLDYCKGCGICASVCPRGAIQMVLEETA
jgi:2-oxoacid:acceptor oxidoreductase delta subunit (pyruvate/2-ketoisovalerate family)